MVFKNVGVSRPGGTVTCVVDTRGCLLSKIHPAYIPRILRPVRAPADDSVTPWSSSPSPGLLPATWPRPVLSQAPPPNPIAAEPDGRRVLSSLKERAGVKQGLACGFAVVPASAGMAELPHGWFPLMAARFRERAGRVKDRAEPGRVSGAAGVLDAGCPRGDNGWPGGRAAGQGGVWRYGRPICRLMRHGRPAGCRHPFGCAPAWLAGGHGAVRVRSGQGQSQPRPCCRADPGRHRCWQGTDNEAATRPAGPAAHAAGLMARRMCPSRMP